MEKVAPFGTKLLKDQFSWKNIMGELWFRGQSLYSFLGAFPYEVKGILRKLRKGKLHLEIEHTGWHKFLDKLDQVGNRLAMALVVSAFVIAGSIIITADPDYAAGNGVPKISVTMFVIAGIMGFFLLMSIWRSGKN